MDTPVTETVERQTVTIRDCRVHDKITFVVPEDLPVGVYAVQIAERDRLRAAFGDTIVTNPQYVRSPTFERA